MQGLSKLSLGVAVLLLSPTLLAANCIQPKVKNSDNVGCLIEGLAAVSLNERSGTPYKGVYVDKNGKVIIPFIYDTESVGEGGYFSIMNDFSEGLAAVHKTINQTADTEGDARYGFIDKTGKTVIPFNYSYANSFSEGLAAVATADGKYGFIDKSNKMVIPATYDQAESFSSGLALVEVQQGESTKKMFIDKTGKVRLTPKYETINSFSSAHDRKN